MVQLIIYDIVLTARQGRDYTRIHIEARRINQRILLANELGQLAFQFKMNIKSSIQETGPGTTRTIFLCSSNSGFLDSWVVGQSHIAVRAKHKDLLATHNHFAILRTFNGSEVWIQTHCLYTLWLGVLSQLLL